MGITVKAIKVGYYDARRRRAGEVFEIKDESERGSWMGGENDPIVEKDAMPFTSQVKGTKAAGNILVAGKEAWEEPVGESRAKSSDADPPIVKKKSRSKTKSK